MMPIDPRIILGIQTPQLSAPDPLEQYGKVMTLKHLMQQGELTGLQTESARQDFQDRQGVRDVFNRAPPGSTLEALLPELYRVAPKTAIEYQGKVLEQEAKRATLQKTQQEVQKAALAQWRDAFANVNDPRTAQALMFQLYNDPALKSVPKALAYDEAVAQIPADPAAFRRWVQGNALGATKMTELDKPHVTTQNLGGTSRIVATPGLGGAPSVLDTQQMTATPGELMTDARTRSEGAANRGVTLRGQNMTDARARETLSVGRWTNDLERGLQVNTATGETRPITQDGAPLGQKGKPLTETQGKAAGMLHRMTGANEMLNALEDAGFRNRGIIKQGVGQIPLVGGAAEMGVNMLPGALGGPSAQQQQIEQARRDFVNAALRVESGAAISQSEFQNAEKQYFPMPGDSPQVLAQKRRNRETEIEGLRLQAGPSPAAASIRPQSSAPTVTPTRADIDAELRRRGIIK